MLGVALLEKRVTAEQACTLARLEVEAQVSRQSIISFTLLHIDTNLLLNLFLL